MGKLLDEANALLEKYVNGKRRAREAMAVSFQYPVGAADITFLRFGKDLLRAERFVMWLSPIGEIVQALGDDEVAPILAGILARVDKAYRDTQFNLHRLYSAGEIDMGYIVMDITNGADLDLCTLLVNLLITNGFNLDGERIEDLHGR